jgi:tRNA(Leu) C34 or U34 (ribose-2'-O)-methylase TrmL
MTASTSSTAQAGTGQLLCNPPFTATSMHNINSSQRGYAAIGLHMPKTGHNVGSAMRGAGCYGASLIAVSGKRYRPAGTDTQKQYRHTPLIHCDNLHDVIPYGCVPVAVDLIDDAQSLVDYKHPERAFYVFGPEDGTLGASVLGWCRDVIYIPTRYCMNLAATVNVVLYDRMIKRSGGSHE